MIYETIKMHRLCQEGVTSKLSLRESSKKCAPLPRGKILSTDEHSMPIPFPTWLSSVLARDAIMAITGAISWRRLTPPEKLSNENNAGERQSKAERTL